MAIPRVMTSREVRVHFPAALERFRRDGAEAEPIIFGAHRKPEGAVIPFALYERFLELLEDAEIAKIARARAAAGPATPLEETAAKLGVDLSAE